MQITTSTCIVGLVHEGVVYIGGDSLGSGGGSGTIYNNRKVFHISENKDIIVGYTSSFRMGQLIQYSSDLFSGDDLALNRIDEKYLITTFIPNLQKLLKSGGYQEESNNVVTGGNFLIGYKDRLFEVQSDYSILEPECAYACCGCGERFALGSLYSTQNLIKDPIERIKLALEAAANFSTGVSDPFYLVSTKDLETTKL